MAKTGNINSNLSFKERLSALKNLPELFQAGLAKQSPKNCTKFRVAHCPFGNAGSVAVHW
jgi:hypothetical protein